MQLALCAHAVPGPFPARPKVPACWEGWGHPQLGLYLGSLWFKRSFRDETVKNGIFIQTLLSLPLCSKDGEREKKDAFSFSLRSRRAKLPCADTRQAAQQRTKLLSVVLLPAIRVPAASRRQPRTLPAVPQPCPLSHSPAHGCAVPRDRDCWAGAVFLLQYRTVRSDCRGSALRGCCILAAPGVGAMGLADHSTHLQSKQSQVATHKQACK